MFSLIITVISIALVAALAVASVYYGGPALSKGTAKASAATIVSQGQQISGAATLWSSDNGGQTLTDEADSTLAFADLIADGYLTSVPAVPAALDSAWAIQGGMLTFQSANTIDEICLEIEKNRDNNVEFVGGASAGGQFGCYATTAGTETTAPVGPFTIYYAM